MSKAKKATKKAIIKPVTATRNTRSKITTSKPLEEFHPKSRPTDIVSNAGLVQHKKKYKDMLSEQGIHQVYVLAKNGMNLKSIADMFGMSWDTLKRYRNQYPMVDEAYKRGRSETINNLFLKATQLAMKDNQGPALFKWIEMFGKGALKEVHETELDESTNNTDRSSGAGLKKQDLHDALKKDKFIDIDPVIIEASSDEQRAEKDIKEASPKGQAVKISKDS